MCGIDPQIFEHEIKTYEGAKPVWKNLQPINPKKVVSIKEEVENILHAQFSYSVPLTEWVSNIVLVATK
jgi:hypothetical protein